MVYFDANQNGNLTDDGKPLTNQGSGIFATTIHLPFRRLVRDAPFPGDFTLWFFTNDSMWPRGAVAHYSRTQLKGTVYVDGHAYMAYIADAGENDTDLTNDGISVDVNGDGEINRQQEFFSAWSGGSHTWERVCLCDHLVSMTLGIEAAVARRKRFDLSSSS